MTTGMNGTYGKAATGLQDTTWAINDQVARIGAKGEEKSAALLDGFQKKAAILHDLRIPLPGFKANIDHIVVSGNRVLILDSKMWKPGFYWNLFGTNRRGTERVDHTAKDQSYVQRAIQGFLAGTGAHVGSPYLVIWSSRPGQNVSTWLLKVPGAGIINGPSLVYAVKKFVGRRPADPAIVARLSELLVRPAAAPARQPVKPLGRDIYDDGDYQGASWWSYYDPRWVSFGLWDLDGLAVAGEPEILNVDHDAVVGAAATIMRAVSSRRLAAS